MKKYFLIGLFLSFYTLSFAQARENIPYPYTSYQKQVLIEFMGGADFDLTHSGSDPASTLMTTRPSTCPMIGAKVTHLFSKRIGWYANIHLNFYRENESGLPELNIIEGIFKEFFYYVFGPIARIRPSMDAGFVYRLEKEKWSLYPRLGIGYMYYMGNRNRVQEKGEKTICYQQKAHPLFLNTGFSVNYTFSERAYLVFNADFRQPLQKSYAELIQTSNGIETDRLYFQTKTGGRGLSCGLGIGVRLY